MPVRSLGGGVPYHVRMPAFPPDPTEWTRPRPIPETYWLWPGRLLVGEHPGSPSRAEAMDRLRRFLSAGVTCFIDLTEPRELPSYEGLLPFATPEGRRVEYLREPVPDHGVPDDRETMARILALLDDALAAGHCVYVHCRAGIGRSATVAGCWLAGRPGLHADPVEELQGYWQQCAKSQGWSRVPETAEQVEYIHAWSAGVRKVACSERAAVGIGIEDRVRGALLGLAAGDAAGAAFQVGLDRPVAWTQHTALALCLAESLLECDRFDARDQMERYVRWQRDGYLDAGVGPRQATPDVARALAAYHWRGQPMAGSHDPNDRSTASLPRVVAAVLHSLDDPAAAVALAGECSRTTHQSPVVIDACRSYAAMLAGALRGDAPARVLSPGYEPVAGTWSARPLRPELAEPPTSRAPQSPDVVHALANAREAVAAAVDFDDAVNRACSGGTEPALDAALAGTLMGALFGARIIPSAQLAALARVDLLEAIAARLAARTAGAQR